MYNDPVLILLYAVLGIVLALLVLEAVFDLRPHQVVSASLRTLDQLPARMVRLLRHRGVQSNSLPADLAPLELERARIRCRNCGNVERCESVIAGREDAGDYGFCENQAVLVRFDSKAPQARAA